MSSGKGLEGVVAATSSISSIIDDQLTYCGYNIDDLVGKTSFEEVIYLLWHRELPRQDQLDYLRKRMAAQAELPEAIIQFFRNIPIYEVNPMGLIRTAVSMLGQYDPIAEVDDWDIKYLKGIKIQAKLPIIVSTFSRIRRGLEPIAPRKDFSLAQNFLYTLTGKEPEKATVDALDQALVIHADHELNASTFTARVCVSTLTDIYSGVVSAIASLKGPLHGGANEAVMKMLKEVGTVDKAEEVIMKKLANKEKIMGFGHRVYQNGDPRAKHLKALSKKFCAKIGESKWFEISEKIEEVFMREKNLPTNVDFYSASFYHALGFDHDLFTPIFAVSRTSGWIAHITEQQSDNRIIRPRAEYTGSGLRDFVPIEKR